MDGIGSPHKVQDRIIAGKVAKACMIAGQLRVESEAAKA